MTEQTRIFCPFLKLEMSSSATLHALFARVRRNDVTSQSAPTSPCAGRRQESDPENDKDKADDDDATTTRAGNKTHEVGTKINMTTNKANEDDARTSKTGKKLFTISPVTTGRKYETDAQQAFRIDLERVEKSRFKLCSFQLHKDVCLS